MDTGPFVSATIATPGQPTMKGIVVGLGEKRQAAVCYDTELLRVSAGWTGGFLRFDPARYGLIRPPAPAGEIRFTSPTLPGWSLHGSFHDPRSQPYGPLPADWARYRGLYLHSNRVVLAYSVGKTEVLESPGLEQTENVAVFSRTLQIGPGSENLEMLVCDGQSRARLVGEAGGCRLEFGGEPPLVKLVVPARRSTIRVKLLIWSPAGRNEDELNEIVRQSPPAEDLREFTRSGSPRWTEPVMTQGVVAPPTAPYVVDTLTLPSPNPYGALLFTSGLDFFSSGDAAVSTVHGDVWIVGGIDETLKRLTWKRFATGLYQPLGLKIVRDQVYVVGRDQLTILHDLDGDGEADYYENLNNEGQVSTNVHEFVTCLETDSRGNFYFLKGNSASQTDHDGCLLRVSPDGSRLDVVATGFRNANGMSIGPDDTITVSPQEGEWTPASAIFLVKPGGFYGFVDSHHRSQVPQDYDRPLCWLPRRTDNSSGGQVWVTSDRWGPLAGQLLHMSYGQSKLMLVLREAVDGDWQGGVAPFPLDFESGIMRARFRPQDGQLYVTGLRGWASNAAQDGCLQRVRYTGAPAEMPIGWRTMQNGVVVAFTDPLDRATAEDPENYRLQQWNYFWSSTYGSPEYRVSSPGVEGRDEVEILSATLLEDQRSVFLELGSVQPAMQLALTFSLVSAQGRRLQNTVAYTIHHVGAERMDSSLLTRRPRPGQLTDAQRQTLQTGLVMRFRQNHERGLRQDSRVASLAALHVAAGGRPTPFLEPGPFEASAEGYLFVPIRGEYAFTFAGCGTASLAINGNSVLHAAADDLAAQPGASAVLHKGYNRIAIDYGSLPDGAGTMRLLWSSPEFVPEPLPPTALFSSGADELLSQAMQLRHGRQLYARLRCSNCHEHQAPGGDSSAGMPELSIDAPRLAGLGARLRPAWIYRWLLDPQAMRNHISMPRMFAEGSVDEQRQQAADVAACLATLSAERAPQEPVDAEGTPDGALLYEDLGCISCHRLTPPRQDDDYDRVSLHFVAAKFRPGAIASFLEKPHEDFGWSGMPDFQLSHGEARALEDFLRSRTSSAELGDKTVPAGDARRGRQLLIGKRCHHCHECGPALQLPAKSMVRAVTAAGSSGCIGPARSPSSGSTPYYQLDEPQRSALADFLKTDRRSLFQRNEAEASARLVETLRCGACHDRGAQPSSRPAIIIDEGERGLPPESLPGLTWAGEKLWPSWTESLLNGKLNYRVRPWLKARMPVFPRHARTLAVGFAHHSGLATDEQPAARIDPRLAEIGYRLTLRQGGLDCRQCHAVGSQTPTGDDMTNVALGINFAHIGERLRYDYYGRFVLDPARQEPSTKMPRLTTEGMITKVQEVFDGDARRQFAAIWAYLQSVRGAP